jgi:hypothetical protein
MLTLAVLGGFVAGAVVAVGAGVFVIRKSISEAMQGFMKK